MPLGELQHACCGVSSVILTSLGPFKFSCLSGLYDYDEKFFICCLSEKVSLIWWLRSSETAAAALRAMCGCWIWVINPQKGMGYCVFERHHDYGTEKRERCDSNSKLLRSYQRLMVTSAPTESGGQWKVRKSGPRQGQATKVVDPKKKSHQVVDVDALPLHPSKEVGTGSGRDVVGRPRREVQGTLARQQILVGTRGCSGGWRVSKYRKNRSKSIKHEDKTRKRVGQLISV
ncbi:hypothetical protein EDB84DRAFT_1677884 [Lactarius hengduanensis]|nr:hypothetical protein EDB84DRAFT_1677884 [Lactarius hengduanensis]